MMSNSLLKLLDPRAIFTGIVAGSATEIIDLLGAKMADLGLVKASYVASVLAREAEMPTGLPLGDINVAVPHTDPEHVVMPAVAVAILARPLDFGNMEDPDEKLPVSIVFLLALTEKGGQIEMLQSIAGLIQNGGLLRELLQAANRDEVLAVLARAG
jgi:PTS system galactitol-specific IIA component